MLCRLLYTAMVAICPVIAASVKAQSGWTYGPGTIAVAQPGLR